MMRSRSQHILAVCCEVQKKHNGVNLMPSTENEVLREVLQWTEQIKQEVSTLKMLMAAEQEQVETSKILVEDVLEISRSNLYVAADMLAGDAVSAGDITPLAAIYIRQLKENASFRESVIGDGGDHGPSGQQGQQGPQGDAGTHGEQGEQGVSGKSINVDHDFNRGKCSICGQPDGGGDHSDGNPSWDCTICRKRHKPGTACVFT
jgi:hypothetical protein